jgi:hypothetical protein
MMSAGSTPLPPPPSPHGAQMLTASDIEWCRQVCLELQNDPDTDGPEVVMTSLGYAEVWPDGDIVFNGRVLTTVEV